MKRGTVPVVVAGILNSVLGGVHGILGVVVLADTLSSPAFGFLLKHPELVDVRALTAAFFLVVASGMLLLASGIGLLRRAPWARRATRVCAVGIVPLTLVAKLLMRAANLLSPPLFGSRPAPGAVGFVAEDLVTLAIWLSWAVFLWYATRYLAPSGDAHTDSGDRTVPVAD